MTFTILLIVLLHSCARAEVFLQQTSPSYHPVCPGDSVTITCNVSTGSTALRWTDLLDLDPSAVDVVFRENTDIGSTGVVGIFSAELIGKNITNFELSSEASVQNIQLNNNESNLSCSDQALGGNMETILILISGVPSRPNNVSFTADTTTHLTLNWSKPTENINCIVKYIVKINDQQMKTTANVTSLSVPSLSIGSVYNVTVYSQDGANSTGGISELLMITWKVPLPVSALSWNISEIDGNTIIILIWEHEEDSSRPPTQHFLISHNISEPLNTTTMNSSIILTGIKRGNTYVINVSAVNILGESLPKDINVHITNTDETMTTSHTGMTNVLTNDVISSTFQVLNSSISTYEHTGIKSTSSSDYKTMSTLIMSSATTVVSSTSEVMNTESSKSASPLVPVVVSLVCGIILALLIVLVCVAVFIVYKRRSGKYKTIVTKELSTNKMDKNLSSEPGCNSNGMDQTESSLGPTYAAVLKKPQPTPLSQYDEVPPPVHPYNYSDEPPKIPPYMGGDEPPPLKPSGGEYSVLQREERNQKERKSENIPPGLYSTINQRKDEPFVLEPSGNEYSVLKRSEREQRERETNPQLESSGSGQYSVLNQNVGNKKTGTGGIIYADLGAAPKNRPIIPPPSGFSEPVVYSSISNPPPVPKRLSQKKKDMIYAQLQLELPPSVTSPPPPSVNIQQEKVIYSSVNKQL